MDIALLLLATAAVILAAGLVIALLRRSGSNPALERLSGAIDAISRQSADAQARMQEQERQFTKALDERFAAVSKRLSDSLGLSAHQTHETMNALRERLAKIDEAQKNLSELSTHVMSLRDILSNKQTRGAFGNEQMMAIVRDKLPPEYFEAECTLSNGTRVDCMLKLPAPAGPLPVDAKFPREAWENWRAATGDKAAQERALRAFAATVNKHVQDIATKYLIPGETAENAMMFVPSEAVYAEIHASLPDVVDDARRHRVFIVSPTTFWAVVNTMRAILRDVRMREQAGIIQKEIITLLDDVRRMDDRVEKLQTHFDQAGRDVRDIRISTDKIIKRGEKINALELEETPAAEALAPPHI